MLLHVAHVLNSTHDVGPAKLPAVPSTQPVPTENSSSAATKRTSSSLTSTVLMYACNGSVCCNTANTVPAIDQPGMMSLSSIAGPHQRMQSASGPRSRICPLVGRSTVACSRLAANRLHTQQPQRNVVARAQSERIKQVNADELQAAIGTARERPIVVDFFATWCGPCLLLAQELEKVGQPGLLLAEHPRLQCMHICGPVWSSQHVRMHACRVPLAAYGIYCSMMSPQWLGHRPTHALSRECVSLGCP
jgi:thiol-disulfide isomerase/thioredoxin